VPVVQPHDDLASAVAGFIARCSGDIFRAIVRSMRPQLRSRTNSSNRRPMPARS
jgi:hypothetical protein